MDRELRDIANEASERIRTANTLPDLDRVRVEVLGRKSGAFTLARRKMGQLSPQERPAIGKLVNELRSQIEDALARRAEELAEQERDQPRAAETVDITLPGRFHRLGTRHPLTLIADEIRAIMIGLGYEVVDGPEIEYNRYNWQMLNYEQDHPAMDEQDSFYLGDETLLRTQTSTVQIREMEKRQPPVRIVTVGRCYRRDVVDATHCHTFHQFECLLVDEGVTMGHLYGTLELFARELFGHEARLRFRPDFFPFTEPSAEFSAACSLCSGSGCPVCKYSGWVELGGCGMVHPNVLRNCGYDAEKYTGFAFGLGIERLAQRRYNIDDIRLFYENDMRFLRQFA